MFKTALVIESMWQENSEISYLLGGGRGWAGVSACFLFQERTMHKQSFARS